MDTFPRTTVGGLSLSRMIIGTNWFLGWSHCTAAKDDYIKEHIADRKAIADIIEVFFKNGVDTIMGMLSCDPLADAIKEAEDRTGVGANVITTPTFPVPPETVSEGFDVDTAAAILDYEASLGAHLCMPHTSTTDCMVDQCTRQVRKMDRICAMIRERGMIPGLSTHIPETIVFSDESGLDVETYISIYNSMGFLMHLEVDWVNRIIHNAKKPVMTIKPMAAGQLRPFQAFNFVWNTIRDCDMVTVGTMSPKEAAVVVELSLGILERRRPEVALQTTRSKRTVTAQV